MLILSLDTTSPYFSVALLQNNKLLDEKISNKTSNQAEFLVPTISQILSDNNLSYENIDLIAATNGPGSFTGSRIGLTAARTIKLALNKPLILLNSCEVIAYKYRQEENIICAMDAAMQEAFCADFIANNNKIETLNKPFLFNEQNLLNIFDKKNYFLCGSGKNIIKELLGDKIIKISSDEDVVTASLVAHLALFKYQNNEIDKNLNPLYLRSPRIEKRKK